MLGKPRFLSADETDEVTRIRLKHPFGKLLIGPPKKTIKILKETIKRESPSKIMAIGDIVASNLIKNGIKVNLIIIDFKSERKSTTPPALNGFKIIEIKNTPGTINSAAYDVVSDAVAESSNTAIIVEGEEDLLTLPVIWFAPAKSMVVYGQPHVGLVFVLITDRIKHEAKWLLEFVRKRSSVKG